MHNMVRLSLLVGASFWLLTTGIVVLAVWLVEPPHALSLAASGSHTAHMQAR